MRYAVGEMGVLRLLGGIAGIVAFLALQVVAIYIVAWVVLMLTRRVGMVGKRHRHPGWQAMQHRGGESLPPLETSRGCTSGNRRSGPRRQAVFGSAIPTCTSRDLASGGHTCADRADRQGVE